MKPKISVVLVDDHALVRRGFRRILEDDAEIRIVGEAGDSAEAIRLARDLRPRVMVMDCALPGTNGLVTTTRVLEVSPQTSVLMLTMHCENTWVRKALEAGARGYILKNAVDLDLAGAIKRVAAGEQVLDPQLTPQKTERGERNHGLTARELEILQLIVDGKSSKEIASDLDLSVHTVAVHRANMMQALGVHKTAELVAYGIRNALVNLR